MDSALREIPSLRRFGVAHCGTTSATELSRVAAAFGLSSDESVYAQVEKEQARIVLIQVLHRDLAYGVECMSLTDAQRLADAVLRAVSGDAATYTNAEVGGLGTGPLPSGTTWSPATSATFDMGVLIVTPRGSVCVWFEDED